MGRGRARLTSALGCLVPSSPNPLTPTLEEMAKLVLTPDEIARCVAYLRPLVEAGQGTRRLAIAYLWSVKR
jgi:hypothetical protein